MVHGVETAASHSLRFTKIPRDDWLRGWSLRVYLENSRWDDNDHVTVSRAAAYHHQQTKTVKAILALGLIYFPEPHLKLIAEKVRIASRDGYRRSAELSTMDMNLKALIQMNSINLPHRS